MTTTMKLNLTDFHELKPLQKLQQAKDLVNAGKGVLRLEEKGGVLYLRERSTFQFLVEKLVLFPKEIQARQMDARMAINQYMVPFLSKDAVIGRNLMPGDQTPLVDSLHRRVYFTRPSSRPEKPGGDGIQGKIAARTRKMLNGMTTVPEGLSIARVSPLKVAAGQRIITSGKLPLQKQHCAFGNNIEAKDLVLSTLHDAAETARIEKALTKHYGEVLKEEHVPAIRTLVLEVKEDKELHWKAAYTASHQFIKKKKSCQQTVSIMLVPPYSPQPGKNTESGKESDNDWLKRINKIISDVEVTEYKSTAPGAATPYTRRKAFLGVEDD